MQIVTVKKQIAYLVRKLFSVFVFRVLREFRVLRDLGWYANLFFTVSKHLEKCGGANTRGAILFVPEGTVKKQICVTP